MQGSVTLGTLLFKLGWDERDISGMECGRQDVNGWHDTF